METNLKKLISILGLTCLSASLIAADADYASTNTQQPAMGFPPAVLKSGDEAPTWFLGASYTLWQPNQGGLALGSPVNQDSSSKIPQDATNFSGNTVYPEFQLRSGFKVSAGGNVHYDGWDVQAEYAWFRHIGKNTDSPVSSTTNGGIYQSVSGIQQADSALFGAWNLSFNRLDATLGRDFYVGHYVSSRPGVGFLGAFEDQDFTRFIALNGSNKLKAAGPNEDVASTAKGALDQFAAKQKWWGFGPYFTMDHSFIFMKDFSIFMDWGLALPWTKTEVKVLSWQPMAITPNQNQTNNITNITYCVQPMLEVAIGLRWDSTWGEGDSWGFRLQAGWECQTWLNHNGMGSGRFGPNQYNNNLTLQGLTIKARVNF